MSTVKTGDLCDAESLSELILPDNQGNNSGVASPQQRAPGEAWHPRLTEKSIRKGMGKSKKKSKKKGTKNSTDRSEKLPSAQRQ